MELPVFDVTALDRGEKSAVLHGACVGTGFFYVAHDVADTLVDAAVEQARLFFALPLDQRMAVSLAHSPCHRGYEAISMPFFFEGNPGHPVTAVPAGETPRYKPTTVSEHLKSMYRQTYAAG